MNFKENVLHILHESFFHNGSIDFVVGSGTRKSKRLKVLLEYAYKIGEKFGEIFLSEDHQACAIILDSSLKITTFQSIWWDLMLLFRCIGLSKMTKVLARKTQLKKHHPSGRFIHLWFIGITEDYQGKGRGDQLLKQILEKYHDIPIYLETSNPQNFTFYEKYGFQRIADLDNLGYALKVYLKP